jgi:glycogen debranching enzyme
MEAQDGCGGKGRTWADVRARSVALWFERDGYRRGTTIAFNRRCSLTKDSAAFEVELAPRGRWQLCVDLTAIVDGQRRKPLLRCDAFGQDPPKVGISLRRWLDEAPELEAAWEALGHLYRRSLLDLASLRIRPDEKMRFAMPAGGVPWFMTLFGRDSLLASYMALPFHAELAQATLEELGRLQASEWDNFRDAEPGKIPHELRHGSLAMLGAIPHSPYYGTHDATPLFLILLDEYERWSGDRELVRKLEPNARAALAWIEGPGDLDGDGYLEYRKRSDSERALANQGWKDSADAILFPDGAEAEPPIATCELQGYAYDARVRAARLARELWRDGELAARLERDAAALKRRFNRDFWSSERRCYVLALDGEKRQVDSVASNMGHLLWSGIVPRRRAGLVVRRILRGDLFSGWGIRSLSSEERGYNPLGYHRGAVWPHDTAIAAEGMRRYGFPKEAAEICKALLDAAAAFGHRLPELFAGFPRDATDVPVAYPGAERPQAWAAAAPLLALRTLLGLDVVDRRLRSKPHVGDVGPLRLRGVHCPGRRINIRR